MKDEDEAVSDVCERKNLTKNIICCRLKQMAKPQQTADFKHTANVFQQKNCFVDTQAP